MCKIHIILAKGYDRSCAMESLGKCFLFLDTDMNGGGPSLNLSTAFS